MDVTTIAYSRFDASHDVEQEPCIRHDGHSWTVRAEIAGQLDPKTGRARGSEELEFELSILTRELDLRHLNDMMPGGSPTPVGVAAWLMERLSLKFPKLTAIEVSMGLFSAGRVTREPR